MAPAWPKFVYKGRVGTRARFPLTPALSLREREALGSVMNDFHTRPLYYVIRFAQGGPIVLPLPEGEGRGEGERAAH